MSVFVKTERVRFAHCDAAGIVFYPRYFELITALQEDWFDQALDANFHDLHLRRNLITPTVKLDCVFRRPSLLGEDLQLSWRVRQIGRSSLTAMVTIAHAGEIRVEAEIKLVFADRDSRKSVAIPDDLRQAILPYVDSTSEETPS